MTTKNQDFVMRSGDTKKIDVVVDEKDSSGAVIGQVNLSGGSIVWKALDTLGAIRITKTTAAGITLLDAVNGKFEISLDPADTGDLEGRFSHEAQLTDSSGNVTTVMAGVMTVEKDLVV